MDLGVFIKKLGEPGQVNRHCCGWFSMLHQVDEDVGSAGWKPSAKEVFFTKFLPDKQAHHFTRGVLGPLLFMLRDDRYVRHIKSIAPEFKRVPVTTSAGDSAPGGWMSECLQSIVFSMGCILTCTRMQGQFEFMPVVVLVSGDRPASATAAASRLASALHHSLESFPEVRTMLEARIANETEGAFVPQLSREDQVLAAVRRLLVPVDQTASDLRNVMTEVPKRSADDAMRALLPTGAAGARESTIDWETWAAVMAQPRSSRHPAFDLAQLQRACSIRRETLMYSASAVNPHDLDRFISLPPDLVQGEGAVVIAQFNNAHWVYSVWKAILECQ